MKTSLVILALMVLSVMAYVIQNHRDYGQALPPGMPADIAIVDGEIISGRRTLFEDGRGYVLDIRSPRALDEVVAFYSDRYAGGGQRGAPGMAAGFSVAEFRVGSKRVFLEIRPRGNATHITMAIHLGSWW